MQSIRDMDIKLQALSVNTQKVEVKRAPVVQMEDNLTNAMRALMVTKQLCHTGLNLQALEQKAQLEKRDKSTLLKLGETLIKKSREHCKTFLKYNMDSKQGQAWCAPFCYHALDYKVETVATKDVKFTINGAIEINLRTRFLHLEPGTIGFNSFTSTEYLEEMLGRFMNARTKGGAKQEF